MTTALAPRSIDADTVARVLLHGDLKQLTASQKVSYYNAVCESVGLNPLTQPFQYLVLNGREILYARREATEQLRRLHNVSIAITARELVDGELYVVTARATVPSGRSDENIGAVSLAGLSGEVRANALMKAETKAKRRATLSICGLGMLDESEVIDIPQAPAADLEAAPPEAAGSHRVAPSGGESAQPPDPPAVEARPRPPSGYYYAAHYQRTPNGFHEFDLLEYDDAGGALKVSTRNAYGADAERAIAEGRPVKVKVRRKANSVGEAYLDALVVLEDLPF